MPQAQEVMFADIRRALEKRDPQFAELLTRYLGQNDPPENQSEASLQEEELSDKTPLPPIPEDAWTMQRLRGALAPYNSYGKSDSEKRAIRKAAWEGLLKAPFHPPRLDLGALLTELYKSEDEWGRAALIEVFKTARLGWGIWQAFKGIYKLAEENHDAAMLGVLAWRMDAYHQTPNTGEVGPGTIIYMRRRAWRYLRQLGQAVPDIYPQFAVQVLRHYPKSFSFGGSWVASHIWAHEDLVGQNGAGWIYGPPEKLSKRAFDEAWKRSSDPLLRLLEDAENDAVCAFAIKGLRADFPDELRKVNAEWLARIGKKPLGSVHDFIVKLLGDSPEFHQSKLKGLGLHDMVLGFLTSDSQEARTYAIEYARSHAPKLDIAKLIEMVSLGRKQDVQGFALERLGDRSGQEIGLANLVKLLAIRSGWEMAKKKAYESFKPSELEVEPFIVLSTGTAGQKKFVKEFFADHKAKVPARYYTQLLDDKRCDYNARNVSLQELAKRDGAEIGIEWIKSALTNNQLRYQVSNWLTRGMFKGDALDVEWMKSLMGRPSTRQMAMTILGNPDLVTPSRIGLSWLLTQARQADESINQFAHRYLLAHFSPQDFAADSSSDDVQVGIDRLWALATGPKEPEQVRAFAQTYLKVHHPVIGPTTPEVQSLGIEPKLPRESYSLQRARPLFSDERADVRRLGYTIGRQELVRWGDKALVYEMAGSRFKEPRMVAVRALIAVGKPDADAELTPSADWLSSDRIFALAESPIKGARELALNLIRVHYHEIGGARRLAWLMESPDREVRIFAVRLLWERHRPTQVPTGWTPKKGQRQAPDSDRFDSVEAIRLFLRTVMFGLPPGRMERREPLTDDFPKRPLPASIAKRRLLEVVRELALEDRSFADVVLPVLEEFMNSTAKGEWQMCIASLAQLRTRYPDLPTSLPQSVPDPSIEPVQKPAKPAQR